jgi:hypothetical protein
VHQIPKAVVVALLRAGRGRHGHDLPSFHHARPPNSSETGESPSLRDDISRAKMQNVRMRSSPARQHLGTGRGAVWADRFSSQNTVDRKPRRRDANGSSTLKAVVTSRWWIFAARLRLL